MERNINSNIISGIEKIMQIMKTLLWDIAKKKGISPLQVQMMEHINQQKNGISTITGISREFGLKKSTVSESVKNLEAKGFIGRKQSDRDARIFYIMLTAEGENIIRSFSSCFSVFEDELSRIDIDKRKIVSLFLMELVRLFHKHGFIQTAKMCSNCSNFQPNCRKSSEKPHFCSYAKIYMGDEELHFNCEHFSENKN